MLGLGIALLVTGTALLIVEAHVTSYGILGVAGLLAMVAGAAVSVDAAGGGPLLVAAIALLLGIGGGAVMLAVAARVVGAARARARTGAEALVGRVGEVRALPAPVGQVFVDGALWRARPSFDEEEPIQAGDRIVVEGVSGLTLTVRRAEEWELDL
jgi:membrane-bound serine protease (ClpP class)